MLILTLAGNTGKDAEFRSTQDGKEFCSFSVGVSTGYGDRKTTTWVDVTKWGKGTEGLARILRKGSKVAVSGEMSTREHNGKTYIQCRADHVTVQGTPQGNQGGNQQRREHDGSQGHAGGFGAKSGGSEWDRGSDFGDDPDIPFLHNRSIW